MGNGATPAVRRGPSMSSGEIEPLLADIDEAPDSDDGRGGLALQRWLQWAGAGSRAQVRELVVSGRVAIDGVVCTRFAEPVAPTARVSVDGTDVGGGAAPCVVLMYKPVRHRTQLHDADDLPGLARYLPTGIPRVFPVGRLDVNTEGLLLFTNDGALARRLLDPEVGVPRVYRVKVRDHLDAADPGFARIREGLVDGGERFRPAPVSIVDYRTRATWIELVLTEGRFREVRRMCAVNRWQIVKLRRVAYGGLDLGDLTPRRARVLADVEVDRLRAAAGMPPHVVP